MNFKYLPTMVFTFLAFPMATIAESTDAADGSSTISNLVFAILPFLILGVILFWFLRRVQSGPRAKQTEQYMIRHQEHMDSLERSLERIAVALERKDRDSA